MIKGIFYKNVIILFFYTLNETLNEKMLNMCINGIKNGMNMLKNHL